MLESNRSNSGEPLHITPITSSNGSVVKVHEPASANPIHVFSVVSFYIVCSIAMVMINKAILNQIPLPLTFLWGQLVVAVGVLKVASWMRLMTLPPCTFASARAILPLIMINVVGLCLNTLCLHRIDAVMFQVTRSLILPITALMSVWMIGDRLSLPVILSCAIIFVGFMVGVWGEQQHAIRISRDGLIFGLLSSLSTAYHSIIIKQSFSTVHHNGAFDLVFYNNLYSAILLLPFWLLTEYSDLRQWHQTMGLDGWYRLSWACLLSGASGLLINVAGFLQIKVTSPLTHTVSSAARGVLQSLCAHLFLREVLTRARIIGISVTLFGSCAYTYFKSKTTNESTLKGKTFTEMTDVREEERS